LHDRADVTSRYIFFHFIIGYEKKNSSVAIIKKLQDEIKTDKFELNKFHASKKNMLVKYVSIDGIPQVVIRLS
jgi:hypothetical protein